MENQYDEDQQPFLPSTNKDVPVFEKGPQVGISALAKYGRVILETIMACMIVFLSVYYFRHEATFSRSSQEKNLASSPVPSFPQKTYIFEGNDRYLHEDMFASEQETLHTLHNWIELSADGRGYVRVDDAESFGLGEAYEMRINDTHSEPVYMMSVFHQLHCLSYLVQNFQQGYGGANLTEEVAHHSAHCFDNIRQAIMCAADTSLEGKTDTPGWGAKHQCTDYDVMLAWANEHTVWKWRKNMPGEAVL